MDIDETGNLSTFVPEEISQVLENFLESFSKENNEDIRLLEDQGVSIISVLLKTILNNAYEGIIIVDKNGIIQYSNQKHDKLFGLIHEKIIDKPFSILSTYQGFHEVLETGNPVVGDVVKILNREIVVNVMPIKSNNKILGAIGFILFKDVNEVEEILQKVAKLEGQIEHYKKQLGDFCSRYTIENIIGESEKLKILRVKVLRASRNTFPVLLVGESGTGKELVAHSIHNASGRKNGPFIRVNCGAIPESLLEAELFGYEPGAFTGAIKNGKLGKFELAENGTIFLDEIGDMSIQMQSKLLRVLYEKELDKIGSTKPSIPTNFRLITATNKKLEALLAKGEFRHDLYYRLNVIRIELPSLREYLEDIPLLAHHFLMRLVNEMGIQQNVGMTNEAIELLKHYDYPGNVRELKNLLAQGINICDGKKITGEIMNSILHDSIGAKNNSHPINLKEPLKESVSNAEKIAILDALKKSYGNLKQASQLLGIHRTVLYRKIKKYRIESQVLVQKMNAVKDDHELA